LPLFFYPHPRPLSFRKGEGWPTGRGEDFFKPHLLHYLFILTPGPSPLDKERGVLPGWGED
ncbi:MAG TPA: hypothetical protein PLF75_05580, partial [Bacteroidales bacterium]|nr:hypothetical protein [Bacteroidales bacterium]